MGTISSHVAPRICLSSSFRKEAAHGCPSSLGELITVRSVFPALSRNPVHTVEIPKVMQALGTERERGENSGLAVDLQGLGGCAPGGPWRGAGAGGLQAQVGGLSPLLSKTWASERLLSTFPGGTFPTLKCKVSEDGSRCLQDERRP